MNSPLFISEVEVVPVKPKCGLLAFASFVINRSFYVGSVAVISKPNGDIRLLYPKKNDVDCFHPISKKVGDQITQVVGAKLNELLKRNEQHHESYSIT